MTTSLMRRLGAAVVWCSCFLFLSRPVAAATEGAPSADRAAGPASAAGTPAPAVAAPASAAPVPAAGAAPALRHGARSKAADGTLLIYDGVAGAWRAPSLGEAFWIGERFYRRESGVWLAGPAAVGPWQLLPSAEVPTPARDCCRPQQAPASIRLPSGIEAVYEPRLKVYKVAGHKGVFLHDAMFYRSDNGLWLGSSSVDGPWAPVTPRPLPVPLRKAVGEPTDGQAVTLASGKVLVWDGHAKVFAMRDKPNVVLHEGRYFEKRGPRWFQAADPAAEFSAMAVEDVPAAVRFRFRNEPGRGQKAGAAGKAQGGAAKKQGGAAPKNAAPANAASKKTPAATDSGETP